MVTAYPAALDTTGSQLRTDIASTDDLDDSGKEHDVMHVNVHGAVVAVETKLGTGASTAVADSVMAGTGSGVSSWSSSPTLGGLTMAGAVACADQVVGRAQMKDYAETVNPIGSKSAAFNIDFEDGNVQTVTISSGTFNVGLTNSLASHSNSVTILGTNLGAGTPSFVAGAHDGGGNAVVWAGGTAPTYTASGTDVLCFTTFDGGTTFYGFAAGLDFS